MKGANALSKLLQQGIEHFKHSGLNIVDVPAAKFRESSRQATPRIIALLSHREESVREAGVDTLLKLSEECKALNFLT